jgi:beta-lactamase superfamily II metal-dependent hydrolase
MVPLLILLAASSPALDIYFIDVEGGAATLIVTPARESLLVDTGWERPDDRDAKRIAAVAQQAGVQRIDYLLTTHYHRDHWGGLASLLKQMPVGKFLDHGRRLELAEDTANFPRLNAAYLAASKEQSQALGPGDAIPLRGVKVRVLASDGKTVRRQKPANPRCANAKLDKDDPSDNARSAGFILEYGRFRFLNLGDLTWNVEHELVCPGDAIGRIHLYQVTHHGAANSSNPVLVDTIAPQVAVINNGPRKGGHPDVLERLRRVPGIEAIYQLHRNVDVSGQQNTVPDLIANLDPPDQCAGRFVKASVAPGGREFSLTNSRTGISRTFAVRR